MTLIVRKTVEQRDASRPLHGRSSCRGLLFSTLPRIQCAYQDFTVSAPSWWCLSAAVGMRHLRCPSGRTAPRAITQTSTCLQSLDCRLGEGAGGLTGRCPDPKRAQRVLYATAETSHRSHSSPTQPRSSQLSHRRWQPFDFAQVQDISDAFPDPMRCGASGSRRGKGGGFSRRRAGVSSVRRTPGT